MPSAVPKATVSYHTFPGFSNGFSLKALVCSACDTHIRVLNSAVVNRLVVPAHEA